VWHTKSRQQKEHEGSRFTVVRVPESEKVVETFLLVLNNG
jgi:hypothetical protein